MLPNSFDISIVFYFFFDWLKSVWLFFFDIDYAGWNALIWWIFLFLSIILFAGVVFLLGKLVKLRREQDEKIFGQDGELIPTEETPKNARWEKIQTALNSDNPADWNIAVIEADKILDDMVKAMGYEGESLGDRMKKIEVSDFLTLDDAWEAHKTRNRIAHENEFVLTRREAKQAIDRFEKVFREFNYI